ncbi:MAG TPA: hypothetical protein VMB85_08915 [Bryobacteraceae bacterium]|nr:hypothetical protein [Bryobacteraceae bacterium]
MTAASGAAIAREPATSGPAKPTAWESTAPVPGGGGATGNVTAAADSLAEPVSGTWVDSRDALDEAGEVEGFEIGDADYPMLGLTAIGGGPARDEQEVEEVERPPEPGDE